MQTMYASVCLFSFKSISLGLALELSGFYLLVDHVFENIPTYIVPVFTLLGCLTEP